MRHGLEPKGIRHSYDKISMDYTLIMYKKTWTKFCYSKLRQL